MDIIDIVVPNGTMTRAIAQFIAVVFTALQWSLLIEDTKELKLDSTHNIFSCSNYNQQKSTAFPVNKNAATKQYNL